MITDLTDKDRIDRMQALGEKGTGDKWILRDSTTGRGLRLHQTSQEENSSFDIREAIDIYLKANTSISPNEITVRRLLNLQVPSPTMNTVSSTITVRQYFTLLLSTIIDEGENFSGKRPFGDSAWEYPIYAAMIEANIINGSIDEDGDVEEVDDKTANELLKAAVKLVFEV